MSETPPVAGRSRRTRRVRLSLLAAGCLIVLVATAVILLRPKPEPYTPGTEAASSDEITRRLDRSLPPDLPTVTFADAAAEAGLRFRHFHGRRSTQLPEDMGSGAAWGDYDDDGDLDLYLVNEDGPLTASPEEALRSPARSSLFRNDGGRFTDVTDASGAGVRGCGMGAAWGDYDGDGRLDLVVTRFGTSVLLRNKGDGTFADVSGASGIGAARGFWTGASWADYDRDGDLDLYVCGYVQYRYDPALAAKTSLQYRALVPYTLNPSSYRPERNLLYRNDGGRFREIGREAGVDNSAGRSMSAAWADFDADGWPDLYVANDVSDNALFHNLGGGRFEDLSHEAWVADYRGAMGLGIGDWDNDADLDMFVTHWLAQENALYDNNTPGAPTPRFLDVADQVGLGQIALDFIGWGADFFDYDNDGRVDLFAVNGSTFQREDDPSLLAPMRNQLFWNGGRGRGFFEVGAVSGAPWLVGNVGRGGSWADYDADGDLDLAIVVNGGDARLLRNEGGNRSGWLRVVVRGGGRPAAGGAARASGPEGRRTTTFANGAVVRIMAGGAPQMREIGSGPSYMSQSPPGETHFGLGGAARVERLEILWPSGARQTFADLPARAVVTLVEGAEPVVRAVGETVRAADGAGMTRDTGGALDRAAVLKFWEAFNRATDLRRRREYEGAGRAYEEALAVNPGHEDSLYYLGHCLAEQGRPDEARRAFARLTEANPMSSRGHLALGAALLSSADGGAPDLGGAEGSFRRAHDINKEETGPMVRLGEVLLVRGDAAGAGSWFEAALKTNPKSVEAAFLLGFLRWDADDPEGARAQYARALRAAAADTPVKGVLGEGDRKAPAAGPEARRVVAPPLANPHGETLFSDLAAPLRRGDRPDPTALGRGDLDRIYRPLRERLLVIRNRAASRPLSVRN